MTLSGSCGRRSGRATRQSATLARELGFQTRSPERFEKVNNPLIEGGTAGPDLLVGTHTLNLLAVVGLYRNRVGSADAVTIPRHAVMSSRCVVTLAAVQNYLDLTDIAELWGIDPATARKYHQQGHLPQPDARTGLKTEKPRYGWLPETLAAYQRPGRGARTDLHTPASPDNPDR